MNLKGKVAIVTGSTSGIGLAIAKGLAASGAKLVLNGILEPVEAEKLRAGISDAFGVEVLFDDADLSRPGPAQNLIANAQEAFGQIDILVNNAGVQYVAPVEEFSPEAWDRILGINLSACFHTIRLSLPSMRKSNWGRIINLASVHGIVASTNISAYVAAKHGLIGLTKAIALETATSPITCNAICPGWVLTPLVEKQIAALSEKERISFDDARDRLLGEKQPSRQFVTVEQISETVKFLCSSAGDQIRGASLNLDGGWLAQ